MEAKIFIGNLDFDATSENLISLCHKFGTIRSAVIIRNEKRESKGFGFVEFEKMQAAQNALALNQTEYMNRILNVSMAIPKARKERARK